MARVHQLFPPAQQMFRILGPFDVLVAGTPVGIGPRQRSVLAALLLHANTVVSVDRLVELVWDRPPVAGRSNVRTFVAALRRTLPDGSSRLRTHPSGYLLEAAPDELDLLAFTQYADEAERAFESGDRAVAAARFKDALGQWRGRALEAVDLSTSLQAAAFQLEQLKVDVVETYLDVQIGTGDDLQDAIDVLRDCIAHHPLRERLWQLLMLALYHRGDKAAALLAYDHMRERIGAELGAEPGQASRDQMHQIAADAPVTLASGRLACTGRLGANGSRRRLRRAT